MKYHSPNQLFAAVTVSAVFLVHLANVQAQAPTVTTSKAAYRTGENITINFANGPANQKDWIGVYPTNVVPDGDPGSTLWNYVDGTQAGATGQASGSMTFTNGLNTAGQWVAYLLENDGYTILAQTSFTVLPGPTITLSKPVYATNETIAVTFANGPGNSKDWVGIYPEGVVPDGDPGSTIWNYVDGTQTGATGQTNGTITFSGGLATGGKWVAYLLENDGYTILARAPFQVGLVPSVMVEHGMYVANEPITLTFTNGPANAKDWIGVYPEGVVPDGNPASTIWSYVDGTSTGAAGRSSGLITFQTGLVSTGKYVAYLLENDGYNQLASNPFEVVSPDAPFLRLNKRSYATRESITVSFTNAPGFSRDWVGFYPAGVTPSGSAPLIAWLYLDGTQNGNDIVPSGAITFPTGINRAGDWVAYLFENDGYTFHAQESFVVTDAPISPTNNIVLPAPLFFENFDSTPEGQVPTGWALQSYTEVLDENFDLQDLNSKSYANWVVVSASRFMTNFLSYTGQTPTDDYRRVLSFNPQNIVNGQTVSNLATGNFLFGDAGYRSGRSQVIYAFTPDYNLTGKTNIYLSFHSLYEQNQDSMGAVEYSIDGGTNWLPIVYLIDRADVITNETGIDAVATLTTEYGDVAYYDDPLTGETKGGTYGTFIGAPISQALAPYISGRINDDPIESKRVELFRLPQADNQARVRFRFAYAGTDSWYFGVDNFGIYSLSPHSVGQPRLTITRSGTSVTVSWTGGGGPYRLEKTTSLGTANWQQVTVPSGASSVTENASGGAAFYRVVDM